MDALQLKIVIMKNIFVLLVLLCLSNNMFAQILQIDWQQCFGGTDTEYAYDIISVPNGYILSGGTKSIDGDVTNNYGGVDMWLIKTDETGNMIWQKTYGGSHSEGGTRIFRNNDGSYYIIGESDSDDGDISNDPYPESTDYWIVKIDSLGTILWEKIVGGNRLDQLWTGTATSDGGIAAFGWTNSTDGDVSTSYGGYDMWLVKLNSDGEILWDKSIGNSGFDYGQAIIETGDKGFLVGGGSIIQEGGNLTCDTYHGGLEAILVKLDSLGNIEWQNCYGGSRGESFTGILELDDGYILVGYTDSEDGDVSGWHPSAGEPLNDIWFVKVDLEGNLIWQKCLGGSRSEYSSITIETISSDYIVFGYTQSNDGDVSGNHSNSNLKNDIWMVKLSSEGEILWQQCFGGINNETVNFGVIQKSDNRYVIAGESNYGPSYDVQCNYHVGSGAWSDFWVFEVYDTTVNITDTPGNTTLKVYPNPATNYLIFELPVTTTPSVVISRETTVGSDEESPKNTPQSPRHNPQSPKITITNTLGQQIAQLKIVNKKTVLDTRGFIPGVYFYTLTVEGMSSTGKVIISN
jgi:hypothetical protein